MLDQVAKLRTDAEAAIAAAADVASASGCSAASRS